MKTLVVILDGAAEPEGSAFARAKKPFLDRLASRGMCGLWAGPKTPEGYNIKSLSELGMFGIFGYSPLESPGRGFMEALALGIEPKEKAVYIRANFATVDEGLKIIDRRAGRDESFLAEIAKDLEATIGGIMFRFAKGRGHRGVLVLEGEGLSTQITDVDTGGREPAEVKAKGAGGELTARVLNAYLAWSREILEKHSLNRKRKSPANYLLLRSPGRKKPIQPFSERFGLTAGAVGNDTVFNGIALYLGMEIVQTGETKEVEDNLQEKMERALQLLRRKNLVFLHIKGADTLSHDKNAEGKARFLEEVDQKIFSRIPRGIAVAIISDHASSSITGEHALGQVPFLVFNGREANGISSFDEVSCGEGFLEDHPIKRIVSLARE